MLSTIGYVINKSDNARKEYFNKIVQELKQEQIENSIMEL
jgi:hypothetical protein